MVMAFPFPTKALVIRDTELLDGGDHQDETRV